MYRNIIFDWNGTLLDDVGISVSCINKMLSKRGLPLLSYNMYRKIFGFPVKDYYEKAGFDFEKEDWDDVAMQYMQLYWENEKKTVLIGGIENILQKLWNQKINLYILSAMEHQNLNRMVDRFELKKYFSLIVGIDDHFADNKIFAGKRLIQNEKLVPEESLMIGDTIHDAEVARYLGVNCLLYSGGHQCREVLEKAEQPIIHDLSALFRYI